VCLAVAAHAQEGPRIGLIDFYGLHKVSVNRVRQALGVREGDPLPRSKGDAEERIDGISGVVESHLEAVCCDAGRMVLYVGIEEKGATHFELREAPDGEVKLPEDIATTYRHFLAASEAASRAGRTKEDLTQGHALSSDPDTREIQEQFVPIVKTYLGDLRHILRDSNDEEQRAIAAYVIAYDENPQEIVNDLQYALKDPDAGVRLNATRGLRALAVMAHLHPDSGLKIEPTWFIEMLNSLSWNDRTQALSMLQMLTDQREADAIEQIRERALPSLTEMARWKTLPHALPAFLLLGRVAGLPEDQVQAAWSRGDREFVIAQAAAPPKKKK
jgi:hypothetical protein